MSSLVFPTWLAGLSYPQKKTPKWSTGVSRALSGKTSRISYQQYPLYEWELSYSVLSQDHPLLPGHTNLVPWSQDLTQWQTNTLNAGLAPVVTAFWKRTKAPDGTYTANRVILGRGSGTGGVSVYSPVVSTLKGQQVTSSIWLKTNDGSTQTVVLFFTRPLLGDFTADNAIIRADSPFLSADGAESGWPTPPGAGVYCTVTPQWQRFSATGMVQLGAYCGLTINSTGTSEATYADLAVWGGQLESGNLASAYIPTFGSPVRNVDLRTAIGLFNRMAGQGDTFLYTDPEFSSVTQQAFATGNGTQTAFNLTAADQGDGPIFGLASAPELIQNANGPPAIYTLRYGAPELLGSSTRTNLILQSNLAASWTATNVTVTTGAGTAPDGTTHATQITDTTANVVHGVSQAGITITGGGRYTFSCFVQELAQEFVQLVIDNGGTDGVYVNFDLGTQTFQAASEAGTAYWSNADVQMVAFQNGFYRLSVSVTLPAADTTVRCAINLAQSLSSGAYPSYAGTGVNNLLVWGAQLEAGSDVTALIPTTTAAATEAADYSLSNVTVSEPVNTFQQVVLTTAPAANVQLAWTGSFFYRCKFTDDSLDFSQFMNRLWELKSLKMESVIL